MKNINIMQEKEYQEYMKDFNKARNAFDAIMQAVKKWDAQRIAYNKEACEINKDDRFSEQHRQKLLLEIAEKNAGLLRAAQKDAAEALPALAEAIENIGEHLDLNDPRLTAAITLATAAGAESMPPTAQNGLVTPFDGNQDALKTLLPILSKAGLHTASALAESFIARNNRSDDFAVRVSTVLVNAPITTEGDFISFRLHSAAMAFAERYGLPIPEVPEDLEMAGARAAMGLPLVASEA